MYEKNPKNEAKLSADVPKEKNLITNLQVFSLLPLPLQHTVSMNIECKIIRNQGFSVEFLDQISLFNI